MSTTYWLKFKTTPPCPTCHRTGGESDLKIGHSAGGWVFSWCGHHEDTSGVELSNGADWIGYLAEQTEQGLAEIVDEYGAAWSFATFVKLLVDKLPGKAPHGPKVTVLGTIEHQGSRYGW